MTSAATSLSLNAFATPDAGSEYFATAEHYRHLARAVVDALRRGCLVLLTGEPPASLALLAEALRNATAPRRVVEISCHPELDRASLLGDIAPRQDPRPSGATGEETGGSLPPSPIFVFADADRLTDAQIEDIFEAAPAALEAGVLLAHSDFRARFESPELRPLEAELAARLCVQHLERDEIEAFIRHQLPPGNEATLFTERRVALIALTSGGDPAAVNRLARRMLEIEPDASAGGLSAKLSAAWRRRTGKPAAEKSVFEHSPSIASPEIAKSRVPPRRYGVSLRLPAAIIIGLGALWLIIGAFGSADLGAVIGLVRSYTLPREETANAPTPAAAALPAEVTAGSSSVTAAAAPSAAPALEAEPAIAGAGQPAPPPSRSIPDSAVRSAPAEPQLSLAELAALVARGDGFLATGDVASARLFFERAADAGDSRAAMRMALTYDGAVLERVGVRGLHGDPERASFWYRRARDLGEGKGEQAVRTPETGPSKVPPLR
jgi:hypothetical protein